MIPFGRVRSTTAAGVALASTLLGRPAARAEAVAFPAGEPTHIVFQPETGLQRGVGARLADYLGQVLGKAAQFDPRIEAVSAGLPVFILSAGGREPSSGISAPANSPEAFTIETRAVEGHEAVVVVGKTESGLKRGVQRLIMASQQRSTGLIIPDLKTAQSPWIAHREWALAPWDPNFARGMFHNPNADKRLNVYLYGDDQIANYVAMFDEFGFNGCQLLESCNGFHDHGSPEAFQSVLQKYARAAHAQGEEVTDWVWAAQFDGYGWVDPAVTYHAQKGMTAYDDPKVRATFEKYYDLYAALAPDVDRLIAHFFDPGSLSREDVFSCLGLLRDKFRARNPRIKLAVDFWAVANGDQGKAAADYMQELADHGFGDALLLETSLPSFWPAGQREALHEAAKRRGLQLGVWGWYTTEMETDQMPTMHVNAHLLSRFYRQIKDGVDRIQPLTYWSEMEAYHLNDIFTMYAAAQLLWNPERDPDQILREIADGIYGARNGEAVYRALKLIEDTRSGPTWDTYWWSRPGYRLGTADPASDLRRADDAIAAFEAMTPDRAFVPKFRLPFPPATWIELTLPHLRQIRRFADFRLKMAAIRAEAKQGASKPRLTQLAQAAWRPVPEYNTWIGIWGQPEALEQEKMLGKLAHELGLALKAPGWVRFRDAGRLLETIQNRQRFSATPSEFKLAEGGSLRWSVEKTRDLMQLLADNGEVEKAADGGYRLVDWDEYRLR
jgi:hypothetical protein